MSISAENLALLRTAGQFSKLHLAIKAPEIVFSCRVNQTITTYDNVEEITYDGGSGTYTNVLQGMTLWVGTAAGKNDKGTLYIRGTPTSSILYFGITSEIEWANDDYLTVINEFLPWNKPSKLAADVLMMDTSLLYTTQHTTFPALPLAGPMLTALELTGATVTHTRTVDAPYCPDGSPTYSWSCSPTCSGITDPTTLSPVFTFDATGWYRICLAVTNGTLVTRAYRWVVVWNSAAPLTESFTLDNCKGDYNIGEWSFSVTLQDEAEINLISDKTLVGLIAEDWYGSTKTSPAGNTVAVGWIIGDSIRREPQTGSVSFTVAGLATMLGQITCPAINLTCGDDDDWNTIPNMTADHGILDIATWLSTLGMIADVHVNGDTNYVKEITIPPTTLWEALSTIATRLGAKPVANRDGELYFEKNLQYLASKPAVEMDLTSADWHKQLRIDRTPYKPCSSLLLSAFVYTPGAEEATALYSKAPGSYAGTFGRAMNENNFIIDTQANLNILCGQMYAEKNNEFPSVTMELSANNRLLDIAPQQEISITMTAAENARGLTWSAKKFIIRRIEIVHEKGFLQHSLDVEGETDGFPAATYYMPPLGTLTSGTRTNKGNKPPPSIKPIVPNPIKPPIVTPPLPPGTGGECPTDAEANGPFYLFYGGTLEQNQATQAPWAAKIRSHDHTNKSTYQINARFQKYVTGAWVDTDDDSFYDLECYDRQGVFICKGTHDALGSNKRTTRTGYFDVEASTDICYWKLTVPGSASLEGVDTIVAWSAAGRCGPHYITEGTQSWWRRPEGGIGFLWEGMILQTYLAQVWTGVTISGAGLDFKNIAVRALRFEVEISAPDRIDVEWNYGNSFLVSKWWWSNWNGGIRTDSANSHDYISKSYPNLDWNNHELNSQLEFGYIYADKHYDYCHQHTLTRWYFELVPQPIYRLIVDNVLLWNLCAADVVL